jgi:hypothetical protein
MSGPYPYRDVTSRLFPLPARDWTENLDEPSYVECNLFRFGSFRCALHVEWDLPRPFRIPKEAYIIPCRFARVFLAIFDELRNLMYFICVFFTLRGIFVWTEHLPCL